MPNKAMYSVGIFEISEILAFPLDPLELPFKLPLKHNTFNYVFPFPSQVIDEMRVTFVVFV